MSPLRNTAALLIVAITLGAAPATQHDFGSWWHDGKAELDGYRYTLTRYGHIRHGQAVAVYVTEPFSKSKNVKVDDPAKNPGDTFDALKLNLVRDFQTGIYDYNTMTSLFVRSADFEPVKVSFSSTEWCGNVYEELKVDPGLVTERLSSYFENESASREERRPPGGLLEEELFVKLRGLRGEFLRPGESRSVPILPSSFRRRLTHQPLKWSEARIERLPATRSTTVPAGPFETNVYVVRLKSGAEGTFFIETRYPHRVVCWEWSHVPTVPSAQAAGAQWVRDADDEGELLGSRRLEYWKLHGEGDERYLAELGLKPLPK